MHESRKTMLHNIEQWAQYAKAIISLRALAKLSKLSCMPYHLCQQCSIEPKTLCLFYSVAQEFLFLQILQKAYINCNLLLNDFALHFSTFWWLFIIMPKA